ncbi:UNVERIFIED_CONTAM: hypothetical protein PYX00_006710 [Menopon gallinae]|uniref:Uncharacterized protein n=1 Tax=Menopon gallinae TaxID=328185 RepID=A0AAW2HW12_9NEOP
MDLTAAATFDSTGKPEIFLQISLADLPSGALSLVDYGRCISTEGTTAAGQQGVLTKSIFLKNKCTMYHEIINIIK